MSTVRSSGPRRDRGTGGSREGVPTESCLTDRVGLAEPDEKKSAVLVGSVEEVLREDVGTFPI